MWEYGYDAADQLTTAVKKSTDPTPQILRRSAYTYDSAGNRTAEQVDDTVATSSYDNVNRLTSRVPGGFLRFEGALDEAATVTVGGQPASISSDNRFVGKATVGAGTSQIEIRALDPSGNVRVNTYQVSQAGATTSFTYDANGNLTHDGTRSFEWDARNQLVGVLDGSRRVEMQYDGNQRRVRVTTEEGGVTVEDVRVLWCRTVACEEREVNGVTIRRRPFAFGEQLASDWFLLTDGLGSVVGVLDDTGTLIAGYAFAPWGERTLEQGTDSTTRGFTGHRIVEGLSMTLYRAYDGKLGRWLSEDPAGFVDGPNLYSYSRNQPTRRVDPFGDQSGCCSCSVKIECRPVGGKWGWLADHCYVVATNSNCQTTIYESGPQNPPGGGYGQNIASPAKPRPAGGAGSTSSSRSSGVDCGAIGCLDRSANNWNSANIAYDPLGPNSNSYASWLNRECNLGHIGPPPGRGVGWY